MDVLVVSSKHIYILKSLIFNKHIKMFMKYWGKIGLSRSSGVDL